MQEKKKRKRKKDEAMTAAADGPSAPLIGASASHEVPRRITRRPCEVKWRTDEDGEGE